MPFKNIILKKNLSTEIIDFLNSYVDVEDTLFLDTHTTFNLETVIETKNHIVNFGRINDFKKINYYFRTANKKLNQNGVLVGLAETYTVRKKRILKKFPRPFNWIYYMLDFVLTRVAPKLWITSKLYFYLSGGKGRVISMTEILGRLVYCGFKIIEIKEIDNKFYFVAKKIKEPIFEVYKPTYGILIRLPRIGKNGKIIRVYKLRTMHAYSEYIQEFVFERNALADGGKLKDDFRVSSLGSRLRKYWIDELPMIINLFKGEMKIVGVRPISKHYMSLYSKELRKLRIKVKPGLLPPFYADNPKTLDDIQSSETKYLNAYINNPYTTDIKYLFKIAFNILFKGKRSA